MRSLVCLGLFLLLPIMSGCSKFVYGIDLVNYGRFGVLVLELDGMQNYLEKTEYISYTVSGDIARNPGTPGLEGLELVNRLYPSIPSQYRNPANSAGRFAGHPNSLPDSVEVAWQLAELRECERYRAPESPRVQLWLKENGFTASEHRTAFDCTWHPLPGKVFRKTLNIGALRQSEAYRKAGRNARLNITLRFMDEEIEIVSEAFAINRWK